MRELTVKEWNDANDAWDAGDDDAFEKARGMTDNGNHPPIGGFVPRPRTIEVVCDWLDPADGAEPLRATLAANLTYAEIGYLAVMIGRLGKSDELTNGEVWQAIAPRVLAWNAVAYDMATGEYAPVPPPAEAGNDALRAVDATVTYWLLYELSRTHLGENDRRGKGLTESTTAADSESGTAGDNSEATAPNGTSISPSPKGSKRRSAATSPP